MNTATRRRIAQITAEDLHRLASQAERKGSRILHVDGTSNHVATSASSPTCYQVSVSGCSCKGFAAWGRCGHWALLLAELGQLPDLEPVVTEVLIATEDVLDEQPAPCRSCRGTGFLRMTTGPALSDWVMGPCSNCSGHQAAPTTGSSHAAARAA